MGSKGFSLAGSRQLGIWLDSKKVLGLDIWPNMAFLHISPNKNKQLFLYIFSLCFQYVLEPGSSLKRIKHFYIFFKLL